MIESDTIPGAIEALAEEFLGRCRGGERPTIAEYTERFPELADRIRAFFPALLMVERLKSPPSDPVEYETAVPRRSVPVRLGEYRILREIGRGGMGVVYEADQESLGRRVALKVLGAPGRRDRNWLLRFQREARAAARLHHTNIVPVFGVGESEGTHFYVMQFIPGLGLDAVMNEVKRLRQSDRGTWDDRLAADEDFTRCGTAEVTSLLATGPFAPGRFRDRPDSFAGPYSNLGKGPSTDSSPAVLLSQCESPAKSEPADQYARRVAMIGVQVAEALDYAHRQGTLHRDIKPSNLLLDGSGKVWVTDFGLAKASDSEDLTHTGDVVGTVRYMAPERFDGRCEPSSDVYALGLTLYELLALRPAYVETDRGRLIRQVTHTEPPRLGNLEPSVPRDLETIIHKTIERDPAHRYAGASDLADDLRRFLDGRAIRARRLSLSEHALRWCRQNPSTAAFVAAILALFALAVGGGFWVHRQRAERRAEEMLRGVRAREAVVATLGQVAELERKELWTETRSLLDQADKRLEDIHDRDLQVRLHQARSDLELAASLENSQIGSAAHFWGKAHDSRATREYSATFKRAGLTPVGDRAQVERIRHSAIRERLIAALDDWARVTGDHQERADVLRLTRLVDPDPLWRDRVRDPALREDRQALERLAAEFLEAPGTDQPPQLLLTLSLLLKDAGGDPEALLRAALERQPQDFWLNLALANALTYTKSGESAGFFRAALVTRPRSAMVWNNLGLALKNTGRAEEATAAFRKAIDLDKGAAAAYSNLGMVLREKGNSDEAMAAFRKAIDLEPDGAAAAYNNLGVTLRGQARLHEATAAFQKAIDLDPRRAATAYCNLAQTLIAQGRDLESIELIVSASERVCDRASIRTGLAQTLEAASPDQYRPSTLRRAINRLIELGPDDHHTWYRCMAILARSGDQDGFQALSCRILEQFGGTDDPAIAERTAKACLLLPRTGREQNAACYLADRAAAMARGQWVEPYAELAVSLADLRRDRPAEALARADRCLLQVSKLWNFEIPARLVRAMALFRLGRPDEARTTLGKASALYCTRVASPAGAAPGGEWHDKVIVEVLHREAETMLLDSKFPVDPFVP